MLILQVSFFYFYIYSFLRKFLIRQLTGNRAPSSPMSKPVRSVKLTVWQDLILGFLSGVTSRAISMPLSIVTLRLQTEKQNNDESNEEDSEGEGGNDASSGLARAVKNIYDEQGLSGFWRGTYVYPEPGRNLTIIPHRFQHYHPTLAKPLNNTGFLPNLPTGSSAIPSSSRYKTCPRSFTYGSILWWCHIKFNR